MFFRNTLIAHKKPIKPYFTGRVVLQAIIDCSDYIKMVQKPRKIKGFRLQGSILGGIAPTRAMPSFPVSLLFSVLFAGQSANGFLSQS